MCNCVNCVLFLEAVQCVVEVASLLGLGQVMLIYIFSFLAFALCKEAGPGGIFVY
jgi:hypothetical protein